jgi:flagellar motor protein MotB
MLLIKRRAAVSAGYGEQEEGSYLASASDLMIGLLFVFIILVVVLALEQQRQANVIKAAGDPRGAVTQAIGQALKDSKIEVNIDPASGVISLPSDILFPLGESKLSTEALVALALARQRLEQVLPCYVASERSLHHPQDCRHNKGLHEIDTIFVEGHTDNRPILRNGTDNAMLSFQRARAVLTTLVTDSHMATYRNSSQQPLFSYSAYGDTRLLKGIPGDDGKNRRVDLRIVLSYQPMEDTLKNLSATKPGL